MENSGTNNLKSRAIEICQELIRIPSVNFGEGKGDEIAIAQYVSDFLKKIGLEPEIIKTGETRANVVAKLEGTEPNLPGLIVHGHIDVVPANASDWQVDPFAAEIKDGAIWGRGAVDMKNMDAMILATLEHWSEINYKPRRNLLIVFFGDEEAGSEFGSRWLVANKPELFSGFSEAVSEVGGFSITLSNGKRVYLIEGAQKGINWVSLTAKGTAGHGSFINRDNAITKLSAAVERIGNYKWPQIRTKTGDIFWPTIAELIGEKYDPTDVSPLLKHLGGAAKMLGATIANSANPTQLSAGYKANVIPQTATAVVDGRFLPGHEEELIQTIKQLAGSEIEVKILVRDRALEVDFSGPLVTAMTVAIQKHDPEAIVIPYLMSGGTDNKALADLGIVGYGFSPLKLPADLDFFALFHGVDERVPLSAIEFGVEVLNDFLQSI